MENRIRVLSHFLKENVVESGKKIKGRGNQGPSPLYISFLLNIDDLGGLVIPDCRLSNGILRPPGRMGNFGRTYFPQAWFTNMLDSPLARELYLLCEDLAARYCLPLQPFDDCMAAWVPTRKQLDNLKNVTVDIEKFQYKD